MEDREYKVSTPPRKAHGPGPMGGGEKPKNLIGTWKKLLGYCRKYIAVIIIALLCAVAGTVLTLIGPDKLSDMTDTITDGIAPDTEMLTEISDTISDNVATNFELVMDSIASNLNNTDNINKKATEIMMSPHISDKDKGQFQQSL
ncbi:MAG: hypothetical protein ACI4QE_04295, partial [Acutalibacteraceae bacterium]